MTQRQQKRDRILRTAFEVWGDSKFLSTSLASVAERLELSKPALYRYFASKDELIAGMQEQFAEDYRESAERHMCWDPTCGLERLVHAIVRTVFGFLQREPAYLTFFTEYLLRHAIMNEACLLDSLPGSLHEVLNRQTEALRRAVGRECENSSERMVAEILQYVFLATLYWCALYFMTPDMRPRAHEGGDSGEQRERHVSLVCDVVLNGLTPAGAPPGAERLAAVEYAAWRNPGTVLTKDRVLAAVEAVVAEVGFGEATIERIANHVGMSKSSLYFYFKNKREMFGELLARENELFLDEYRRVRVAFVGIDEHLYAYVVLQAAFFAHNPGVFKVVNWLWSQSLEAVELPEEYMLQVQREFAYVQQAIDAGRLRASEEGWMSVVGFFHVGGVMLFARHLQRPPLENCTLLESARALFILGMYGVRGMLGESEQSGSAHSNGGSS